MACPQLNSERTHDTLRCARESRAPPSLGAPVNGHCAAVREALHSPAVSVRHATCSVISSKDALAVSRCSHACAGPRCGHLPGPHADACGPGVRGG
ncbi:MAG: hypothetical protein ACK56F_21940, partial [bacterium]